MLEPRSSVLSPLIRKFETLAPLAVGDRQALDDALGPIRHYARGAEIVGRGEPIPHAHIILEGWVYRYTHLPDGQEHVTGFLLPGDLCSPFGSLPTRADFVLQALTRVSVAQVPFARLRQLAEDRPSLDEALWRDVQITLATQREWLVNVGRRLGAERLGHLLCELHARLRAVGLAEPDGFGLPATQEVLAGALGMTTVHLSRTAKNLRMRGLLRIEGRYVTFPNLAALRMASEFDPHYLLPERAEAPPGPPG